MILLRTDDENGKMQFVTVRSDSFYRESNTVVTYYRFPAYVNIWMIWAKRILKLMFSTDAEHALIKNMR